MRWGYGADADQAEQAWCTHATCREDQERDLAFMGAALDRKDLRALADAAHQSTVRCRLKPRKGAIRAPFPPRKEAGQTTLIALIIAGVAGLAILFVYIWHWYGFENAVAAVVVPAAISAVVTVVSTAIFR